MSYMIAKIVDGARVAVEFGPAVAVAEVAPVLLLQCLSTYKKAHLW